MYGIATALKEARFEKVLILPGDVPLMKKSLLVELSRELPPTVLREGERLHSLITLLKKEHLIEVERLIKEGIHRVSALHQRLKSRELNVESLINGYPLKKSLTNVNYFDDYKRLF
jgi:molybdopterin-guanine dinucleotide biosynthesis protein A